MKKFIRRILVAVMAVTMSVALLPETFLTVAQADETVSTWDGSSAVIWNEGSGTEADPFIIESADNLAYLAGVVNGTIEKPDCLTYRTARSQWFKLDCDLDLGNWTPIGYVAYPNDYGSYTSSSLDRVFGGNFDGNGHTITLDINSSNNCQGVFGFVGVDGNVAAVVSTIENLTVKGTIDGSATTTYCVSGLCAFAKNVNFINCVNEASIKGEAKYVGGLVGCASSGEYLGVSFTGCANKGNITGFGTNYREAIGGIAGCVNEALTMTNCYNLGEITNLGTGGAGGLIGNDMSSIASVWTNCYSGKNAKVSVADTGKYFGAIGGYLSNVSGSIYYCANSSSQVYGGGTVSGTAAYTEYTELLNQLGSAYKAGEDYEGAPVLSWENVSHTHVSDGNPKVVEPTCLEGGYTVYTCSVCKEQYIADQKEALGHDYQLTKSVEKTCTEDGYEIYTCSRCGDTCEKNRQTATGHNFENGKCTECGISETFEIANEEDLLEFAKTVSYGDTDIDATLTADITLTGEWTPIATSANPYEGTFDGAGHVISGLKITGSHSLGALFAAVKNAEIKNLVVRGYINNTNEAGYSAGVAAMSSGITTFTNVGNEAIIVSAANGNYYSGTGGILGYIENSDSAAVFNDCYNKGYVSSCGSYVGGIVGGSRYDVFYNAEKGLSSVFTCTNCYNNGNIIRKGSAGYAGAIVGCSTCASLTNCFNTQYLDGNQGELVGNVILEDGDDYGSLYPHVVTTNCYGRETVNSDDFDASVLGEAFETTSDGTIRLTWEKDLPEEPYLVGIEVSGDYKTDYLVDETFNTDGMNVTATYSDGSQKEVKDFTISNTDPLTVSDTYVYVQYTDEMTVPSPVKAKIDITVTQPTNEITFNCTNSYVYVGSETASEEDNEYNEPVKVNVNKGIRFYFVPHAYSGFKIESVNVTDADGASPIVTYYENTGTYIVENVTKDLTITVVTGEQDKSFDGAEGSGTEADPYIISTEAQLRQLATEVNGGKSYYNVYFKQDADIELTSEWTPIGTGEEFNKECAFMGIYDGGEHSVTGLDVDTSSVEDYYGYGLFGNVAKATIKNLSVEGRVRNLKSSTSDGSRSYFGGIVGTAEGLTIENCVSHVDVTNCFYWAYTQTEAVRESYVGGIVGYSNGKLTMTNCYADGMVSNEDSNEYYYNNIDTYTGGVLGGHYLYEDTESAINNCFFDGILYYTNESCTGTAGGYNKTYTVENYYYPEDYSEVGNPEGTALSAYGFITLSSTLNGNAGKTLFKAGTNGCPMFTWEKAKGDEDITTPDASWYDDSSDSFEISDFADLLGLASLVKAGKTFEGKTVELTADISITDDTVWTPIGSEAYPFSGTFDGNDHTVELKNAEAGGLFGYVSSAKISYVFIKGTVTGANYTGAAVNRAYDSEISYLGNEAEVSAVYSGNVYVGGVVGYSIDSEIKDCFNKGNVSASGYYGMAGGIIGRASVEDGEGGISSCYNRGGITGGDYAGGIAGYIASVKTSYNYSTGTVTSNKENVSGDYSGAIAGSMNEYYVQDGFNYYLEGSAKAGTGLGDEYGYITALSADELKSDSTVETLGNAFAVSEDTNDGFPYLKWEKDPDFIDENIIEIYTKTDLYRFMNTVGSGNDYTGLTVRVMNDIDLGGSYDSETGENSNIWTPIGDVNQTVFNGTFDGQGYTISGMVIVNNNSGYEGLFAATYKDAVIENVNVTGLIIGDNVYPGGIVGWNVGTVKNSSSDVDITVGGTEKIYAGGIAADNAGIIDNCDSYGDIVSKASTDYIGGITGHCEPYYDTVSEDEEVGSDVTPEIKGCRNFGNIKGNEYVGGIVGGMFNESYTVFIDSIEGCLSAGKVELNSSDSEYIGLIGGHLPKSVDIINCYYALDVNEGLESAGGSGTNGNDYLRPVSLAYSNSDEFLMLIGRNTSELETLSNLALCSVSEPVALLELKTNADDSTNADLMVDDVWTLNAYEDGDSTKVVATRLDKAYTGSLTGVEYEGTTYTDADSTDTYGNTTEISFTVDEEYSDDVLDNVKLDTKQTGIKLYVNGKYVKTLDEKVYEDSCETEPVKFSYEKNVYGDDTDDSLGSVTKYVTVSRYLTMEKIAELAGVEYDSDLAIKMRPVDYRDEADERSAEIDSDQILAISMYSGNSYVSESGTDTLNAPRLVYKGSSSSIDSVKWVTEIYVTGNVKEQETGDLSLDGASLSLKNNTDINIYVAKDSVTGYSEYGVKAVKDGDTSDSAKVLTYQGESTDGTCYVYKFADISAKEFSDNYSFYAYGINDGTESVGTAISYSVKDYCMNKLESDSSSDKLKTVCADLLNYGAAAQEYFGYKTSDLANKDMTDEEMTYATGETPEMNSATKLTGNGQSVTSAVFKAAALTLSDSVNVKIYLETSNADDLMFVTWIDLDGDSVEDADETSNIDGSDLLDSGSEKVLNINTIKAKDMRSQIKVYAVNKSDGAIVSDTLTYSIESYCYAKSAGDSKISDLCVKLMKYADSTKNYFNN